MCGVSGEFCFAGGRPDLAAAAAVRDRLAHRGPDDQGLWHDDTVALASRRLSILDPSPAGHMPMIDDASGLVIVLNGEILNFRELRRELEARGDRFRSDGDTEVLLKLLAREGTAALPKLRGMFAFACWNPKRRLLLTARDPFGIKPLYLHRDGARLLFASEMKAILAHPSVRAGLSPAAVSHYFAFGYTGGPHPLRQGISKLPAGTWQIDAAPEAHPGPGWDGPRSVPVRYWDAADAGALPRRDATENALAKEFVEVLQDSVRAHLVSDVPVGVFLSGGVDSAAILALAASAGARDLNTFCIGYPGPADRSELADSRRSSKAFGSRHHELVYTAKDFAADLPVLSRQLDEPAGDAATFPMHALARLARQHVKVVLTGDGGDELFGGYRRYAGDAVWDWYHGVPRFFLRPAGVAASLLPGCGWIRRALRILDIDDPAARGAAWQYVFAPADLDALLLPDWNPSPHPALAAFAAAYPTGRADALMIADQRTKLSDGYCERVDRPTMAVGLEARVPYLDVAVARFARSLPPGMKIRGRGLKVLMRHALQGIVPAEILALPKRGFTVPIPDWLRNGLRPLLRDVLSPEAVARRGILRPAAVASLVSAFEAGDAAVAERLWLVFSFEVWCREHLDRSA